MADELDGDREGISNLMASRYGYFCSSQSGASQFSETLKSDFHMHRISLQGAFVALSSDISCRQLPASDVEPILSLPFFLTGREDHLNVKRGFLICVNANNNV